MAKEKGFYKDVGLELEIKPFAYHINVVDEVLNGKSTYGIGRSSLVKHYASGKPIVLLSAIFQSSPSILIALKSSNIKSVKDFKNKTLMLTQDYVETASIHAMIMSKSTKEDSIKFKKHTFNLEELIDGKVDLYAAYSSNEPFVLKKRKIPFIVFSPKDEGFDFYSDLLFTNEHEVIKYPQKTKNFKEASLKGWKYAFDNINETVDFIYKNYNSQNKTKHALLFEAQELKKLAYANNSELGELQTKKLQRILDIYKVMGMANGNKTIDRLIFDDKNIYLTDKEQNYLKQKKVITICVAPDSLPYSAIENGKFIGIGASVLELVQNITNTPFKLIPSDTWEESIKNAIQKKCDLLPLTEKTPSRAKFFNFTKPYYKEPLAIITKKETNYIIDFKSVLNEKFCIVKGNSFIEHLKIRYPTIKLKIVDSIKDGIDYVSNDKCYGYIDVMMSAAYTLQKLSKINLKINSQFDDKVQVSFALRNDDPMLLEIFNKAVNNISTAKLQNILNKWVSINYTNDVEYKYITEFILFTLFLIIVFYNRQHFLNKKNKELKSLQDELLELNKSLETRVAKSIKEIHEKDTYLLQQSRLAQMGEMMSMIAHQWKQPLGSISATQISMLMAIELDGDGLDDKEKREKFFEFLTKKLKKIGLYTQHLSAIISDFSDFYKPSKNVNYLSVDEVVLKAYRLIQSTLDDMMIEVVLNLDSRNKTKLYENEFMQVVLNIINNAKEQLMQKSITNPKIVIKSYEEYGTVFLEISDNGGGIKDEILGRIFEPYYSTKLEKNGTGLGLHMSKNIIEQHHHGKIYAKNQKDGAIFTIRLSIDKEEN